MADPDRSLGGSWKTSTDRVVTGVADATSFKILVADELDAYRWKTAAALSEPGMPADSWIGNTCVMDRDHVAAVYAPRSFTNKPDLMQGGAFTAVIDTSTGDVTKLPLTGTLAYFDPSCNTVTHTAAFTQYREMNDASKVRTRVITVNTAGKTLYKSGELRGQVSSPAPVEGGVVAGLGQDLVQVGRHGRIHKLAHGDSVPFDIRPMPGGKTGFMDRKGIKTGQAKVFTGHGRPEMVAAGPLGDLDLVSGTEGRVFLTGHPGADRTRGSGVSRLNVPADTEVSSHGRLAVEPVLTPGIRAGLTRIQAAGKGITKVDEPQSGVRNRSGQAPQSAVEDTSTIIRSTAVGTGKELTQRVTLVQPRSGNVLSPALAGSSGPRHVSGVKDDASNDPTDTGRWCSVSRNDMSAQALQPTPNQVEWAVDMAVRGQLRSQWIAQGGWRAQAGLGTIDPQGLFPRPQLNGGGQIPANVMLGILAQESNLWQAESGAIPGQMGNPLAAVDGYYGHTAEDTLLGYWRINWNKSDCGYGVGQVTDGMRLKGHEKPDETALDPKLQKAIAVDYATNIAASMKILADKWNEVHTDGQKVTVNNDNAAKVENWFTAAWNYNLGFNAKGAPGQSWGLGWYNNPANPLYKKGAWDHSFMNVDLDPDNITDAAHPQYWPYEEKVMGWSAWSIDTGFSYGTDGRQDWKGESGFATAGFRPAYWNGTNLPVTVAGSAPYNRAHVSPPLDTFCNVHNGCNPSSPVDCPDQDCYKQFWWNQPNATWKKDCDTTCGNENIKYATLRAEPGRGYRLKYGTPVCGTQPAGSDVVTSIPNGMETWSDCGKASSAGQFKFTFFPDWDKHYEAKADLYSIGGGHGGHFWYTHTRNDDHLGGDNNRMTIKGEWTADKSYDLAAVYAYIPDTGAQARHAQYTISGAQGGPYTRVVDQNTNNGKWVQLGAYKFSATPKVTLTNYTKTGTGDDDIAWNSLAFKPIKGKFVQRTLTAASVFDPNQKLDSGPELGQLNSTPLKSEVALYDWAQGLAYEGPRWDNSQADTTGLTYEARCPTAHAEGECTGQKTYDAAEEWYKDIKAGGFKPTADGSAPAMSVPVWMGMANRRPDTSLPASQAFQDPNSYKIRSDVEVTYIVGDDGKIVDGTVGSSYRARVGNAHLPTFVTKIMKAIEADYGILAPDIDYTTQDALEYGNVVSSRPYADGDTPGQAYFPHFQAAQPDSSRQCVNFRAVGGGVHGYRAMIGHKYINDNVKAWVDEVKASLKTNYAVRNFAGDVYSMFFKNSGDNNVFGSLIGNAPPIWQDIAGAFCADGSIKPMHRQGDTDIDPSNGLVFQSYMPDLYVYVDDRMTDNLGRPSNQRVHAGDWVDFSNPPFPATVNGNAYGRCDAKNRGSGGNPWSVNAPVPFIGDGPGNQPSKVVHCDDPLTEYDVNLTQ
ncbi:golvesin C-terminal-like domain-containing protein [Streptomyces murinus]|uniref:golvesin C-terminal-like domain-containing protein n=1 Tax=Streptomyces murinus TaxID=33900 RepID=UPI0038078F23